MSKGKKVELQVTVQNQEQWEELLQKDGLIVVDVYAAWCGPCKAVVSTLRRIKNEVGDSLLHFATAETDNIDSLSLYRGKSQPTFLFYACGTLVHVIRGCNCPVIIKTIKNQLEKEHKVLEGKAERIEFIDKEVCLQQEEEKKDEEKAVEENEEEELEVPKEVSLAIIKPDAVKAGLIDEIIAKVEAEGMEILRKEERTLTREEAQEFYKQHQGSEHFEELVEFMSSGPCLTLIISKGDTGHGVIPEFRDLIGPKDVNVAKEEAPTSIRALYGTSSIMNAVHACDTSESAARELAFFFPDFVSPAVKTKKVVKRESQRTLALIRPDALRHHKDAIIEKIEEAGFSIAMAKELTLTREEAEDFYAEHKDKDFFESLVRNMCSGPVMALCLARDDAVEGWRNMLGPKEVDVAVQEAPESLRAQFKVEDCDFNPLHGSASRSAAHRELRKIFPVQTTVAVIKPETAAEDGDAIIDKIQESGFRIISRKDVGLTKELASQFYQEHAGKDFFEGLTDYMSSGHSTVLLLEREDAVSGWRAMMGPTDPDEAREKAPDSIRAMFGKDIVRNAVHGSSNTDKAGKVIEELFPDVELLPDGTATVKGSKEDVSQESGGQKPLSEEQEASKDGGGKDEQENKEGQVAAVDSQITNGEEQVAAEGDQVSGKDVQDEPKPDGDSSAGVNDGGHGDVPIHDGSNKDSVPDDQSKGEGDRIGDTTTAKDADAKTKDNTTGDGTTGDGTTGDGAADDATTGGATTGDGVSTGDGTTGDGAADDITNGAATTADGTSGDSATGGGTSGDGATGDGTSGDDAAAGSDTTGDTSGDVTTGSSTSGCVKTGGNNTSNNDNNDNNAGQADTIVDQSKDDTSAPTEKGGENTGMKDGDTTADNENTKTEPSGGEVKEVAG